MKTIWDYLPEYTWANLLEISIFLVIFWFVLLFFGDIFKRTRWFGKSQDAVQRGMDVILLLFEYFSGRIVRFDKKIATGKSINTGSAQGIIDSRERLGLRIKTSKGIQFVGYSNLLRNGYMLLADKEIGGFYHLRIKPEENNENKNHLQYLFDLLVTTPFIDHSFKPEFIETEDKDKTDGISMQVSVREKTHLSELTNLIKERGYLCKILKK